MKGLDKSFIVELKSAILKSRYIAARLVNRELIVLYFNIGAKISIQTKKQAWGSKVLEQISNELQNELPGLKGFSASNLRKMTLFYNFWSKETAISSTLSNQFENTDNETNITLFRQEKIENIEFSSTVSNQIEKSFSSVSFSNHFLIVTKSKTLEQALFYLQKSSSEFWSYRTLEHQLKANLYAKEGKLPNNFIETLPEKLSNNAIQVFKDEYLLDFINIEDPDEMYKNILPDADSLKRLLE